MHARPLSPTDAARMAAIHAASFPRPWDALEMSRHLVRDLCVGAGEPLASFAILRTSDVDAEVLTVATDPARRGCGLGRAVLEAAHARCRAAELRDVFLEVAEDNAAARALYAALGYRPIGRRPGYYQREGGRVAAITYGLSLEGGLSLDGGRGDG